MGRALTNFFFLLTSFAFSGYTVPHPLLPEMHLRVATNGPPAIDVTATAAQNLIDACNHMEAVFSKACDDYRAAQ